LSLSAGSRLGPYEILAPLGAGGMGEVYKARDTRLDRTVAVKVLPERLSASEEMRQRFEREARAISQLSHAHICALYDVGSQDGVEYLVMEYLEGETLAERLSRGALPLEQTLPFAMQIADALDKAHRQGIVHRDLKPGNVMLTKSGVKLLDFGLAKAMAPAQPQSGLTSLPTVATPKGLTQQGMILGTFQYMAPEQLEGAEADARSDIFAFGAVLYEMTTGQKAFQGKSQASLVSSILKEEPPPISAVAPMTPPALERVIRTCLAKDPEDRFQTAHDVKLQLQWVAEGGSQAGVPAPVVARRRNREKLAWAVAAVAVLAAALFAAGYVRRAPKPAEKIGSFLLPPEKADFEMSGINCGSLTISPDGRFVTFAARTAEGKTALWLRPLGSLDARPIPGTEGAAFPFWSPDSRFLAFFADAKLQKVDLAGAPPLILCDATDGRSGGWNREGVIVFSPDTTVGISRVAAGGGAPVPVTKLDTAHGETTHRWATFLPDGRHFLYMAGSHAAGTKAEVNAIYVGAFGSSEKTLLMEARSNIIYASGYLLYMRESVLLAQRFDPGSRKLIGDPIPLAQGVQTDPDYFRGVFGASDNGLLVYGIGAGSVKTSLFWYDRSGKRSSETLGEPANFRSLAIAPDGVRYAATITDPGTGTPNIWIGDSRGTRTRFTFGPNADDPVWSPDGSRIAFVQVEKQARMAVYVKPANGGQEELLYRAESQAVPTAWSRDGRFLALYVRTAGKSNDDIWILPLAGDRKPYPLVATDSEEYDPTFSPDGRWMTYVSNESGKYELYAIGFPTPGGKWQISNGGAVGGQWTSNGKEILYINGSNEIFSVGVQQTPSGLTVSPPNLLFRVQTATGAFGPDGARFLLSVPLEGAAKPRVALVTNWMSSLSPK
jgi:Tol biopolymer transport system component/predicted Ser/Thr protein kinase